MQSLGAFYWRENAWKNHWRKLQNGLCIVGLLGNGSINTLLSPTLSWLQNNPFSYMDCHFVYSRNVTGSPQDPGQQVRIAGGEAWSQKWNLNRWCESAPASKSCSSTVGWHSSNDSVRCLRCTWCLVLLVKPQNFCDLQLLWKWHLQVPPGWMLPPAPWLLWPGGLKPGWKLLAFCDFIWITC